VANLIAVGEVLLDLSAPELEPGSAVHGPVRVRVGGTPVNAAIAATGEGATAAVVGRVGDDPAGRLVRETLRDLGIEAALAIDAALPTGTFLAAGPAIAADRGASASLAATDLPERLAAPVVLVSRYAPAAVTAAAVARADADWVAAAGGNAAILSAEECGGDPEAALARLAAEHRLACVTLGSEGAIAALDGAIERRRPTERLAGPAVGAGDAFAAALLLALVRGLPLGSALEAACAAAVRFVRAGRP
jgi:ribokinase